MTAYCEIEGQRIVDVSEKWTIRAPAAAVWAKICEPNSALEWHDRIATSDEYVDDQGRLTRRFTLHPQNGVTVVMIESEISRSDEIKTITYVVALENLPISGYHAQFCVTPLRDEICRIDWRSRFVRHDTGLPEVDARDIVSDFYITGLAKLAEMMER